MGNFAGENFLSGGGNLENSDFNLSILYQSYSQHSVNIEHQLKLKLIYNKNGTRTIITVKNEVLLGYV